MPAGADATGHDPQTPTEDKHPLVVLITVPTLDAGAADEGAIDLARILVAAGHRPIVASQGGRLEDELARIGGEFVRLNTASRNPFVIMRNAVALRRLVRERGCDVVHAHGRAPGWSAWAAAGATGVPFLTTCYTAFREQNLLKHWYNGVIARGDHVIAVSEQLGDLLVDRHGVAPERLTVIHPPFDLSGFDPALVSPERVAAVRAEWGVHHDTTVVLFPDRIIRRKGHHVAVQAAWLLKQKGLKEFLFVFAGEDNGRSRYSGELWDLVLASDTADVVRICAAGADAPARYATATVVVSAAIQLEGLQRGLLEGMAMARPVIASDLAAGPDAVLSPPAVAEDRMTGLRFVAGDAAALAAALIRMLAYPEPMRQSIGQRGRAWICSEFDPASSAEQTLAVYARVLAPRQRLAHSFSGSAPPRRGSVDLHAMRPNSKDSP